MTFIVNLLLYLLKTSVYTFCLTWGYSAIAEVFSLPRFNSVQMFGITVALMTISAIFRGLKVQISEKTDENLKK